MGLDLFVLESSSVLVHQSLDYFVVVLLMGLSDIGFCVFSLGSICVGLMLWIRVVVAFLLFCLLPL